MTVVGAMDAPVPVGLPEVNCVPEPSSKIVAVPVTATPVAGVAVKVNVWPLSATVSFTIAVRTSNLPVLSTVILPEV